MKYQKRDYKDGASFIDIDRAEFEREFNTVELYTVRFNGSHREFVSGDSEFREIEDEPLPVPSNYQVIAQIHTEVFTELYLHVFRLVKMSLDKGDIFGMSKRVFPDSIDPIKICRMIAEELDCEIVERPEFIEFLRSK